MKNQLTLCTIYLISIYILVSVSVYSQDGTVDSTFGTNGRVMTTILEELKRSAASDIIIQNDGKILASGEYDNFGKDAVVLVRYNTDGSLDQTFGEDGIVKSYFNETMVLAGINGLAFQNDGKIIVSGYSTSSTDFDLAVMRFQVDGQVDSTFGINGRVLTPIGFTQDYAYDMLVQNDNKIVLAGATHESLIIDGILVRYLPDGQLDDSFGNGGIVITDFSGGADDFRTLAIQTNGKIVAGGYSNNTATGMSEFAVAKFNQDGSMDTSFDEDGKWTSSEQLGIVKSISILNENKILIAGDDGAGSLASFARLNSDGTYDVNFGSDGKLKTNYVGSSADYPSKILVQEDEKFISIGVSYYNSHFEMSAQRFNGDGSVDESFGSDGSFFIDLNGQNASWGNAAAMNNNGSIFIAGNTLNNRRVNVFSLLKLNNNSSPLVSIKDDSNIASSFKLHQNYPNPFNPTTSISYTIKEYSNVRLEVFNLLGERVSTLVNKVQNTGRYSYQFDSSGLTSGTYIYRLIANGSVASKKMIILK